MVAPIQALQTLANAADQAAASSRPDYDHDEDRHNGQSKKRKRSVTEGGARSIHLRVKRQTKPDPTPRNPFPDVVTKGLIPEAEARELWDM